MDQRNQKRFILALALIGTLIILTTLMSSKNGSRYNLKLGIHSDTTKTLVIFKGGLSGDGEDEVLTLGGGNLIEVSIKDKKP